MAWHLKVQKWPAHVVFLTKACFDNTAHFSDISTSRSGPSMWCFNILTWKRASRHNSVHFSNISTSKSGLKPFVFSTFDWDMCFPPQQRRLFEHLNFQKWSEAVIFFHFWLGNVLRATMACSFSSLIWPAGFAPAAGASLLFDPPEPQIIWKTHWIATFGPFRAPASSLFSLFLFSYLLFLLFSSLTLPTSAFPSAHIVGSLTSKLPSISNGAGQEVERWW